MREKATNILMDLALSEHEAAVYLLLAERGEMQVPDIAKTTNLSRTSVYEVLNSLIANDFVLYEKRGREAFYEAAHPNKLAGLKAEKQKEHDILMQDTETLIAQLAGAYNLTQQKPGVRFFEGKKGALEALYQTLNSRETIYSLINNASVAAHGKEEDITYTKERIKRSIKKRIIMLDDSYGRRIAETLQKGDLTEVKMLAEPADVFAGTVQVYDDSILQLTAHDGHIVAVLIQHQQMANQIKTLLKFMWKHLPPHQST